MKTWLYVILIFCSANINAEPVRIVAEVNGVAITSYDLEACKRMISGLNNLNLSDPQISQKLNLPAVNTLIDKEILLQYSKKNKIKIDATEIDNAIANIASRNKLSVSEFNSFLSRKGIDNVSFRNHVKIELIKLQLTSSIVRNIDVTEREIESLVLENTNKNAEINAYIFTSISRSDSALTSMQNLRNSSLECEKPLSWRHNKIATCSPLKSNLREIDPKIGNIIKDLREGETSTVIDDGQYFSFILLCSKKITDLSDEETNYVTNFLINKKTSQKTQKFLEDLRKKAYVKVML